MAYRVSQPLATSPSPNGDDKKKKKSTKMKTRPATEIKSKGPKSLVTRPPNKKKKKKFKKSHSNTMANLKALNKALEKVRGVADDVEKSKNNKSY